MELSGHKIQWMQLYANEVKPGQQEINIGPDDSRNLFIVMLQILYLLGGSVGASVAFVGRWVVFARVLGWPRGGSNWWARA